MNFKHPNRRVSFVAVMGVLMLAAAVFGWGLEYKISLYSAPDGPLATTPHAKLLSQKERAISVDEAGVADMDRAVSAVVVPSMLFLALQSSMLLLILFADIASGLRFNIQNFSATRHRWLQDFAASSFFFFRPPPSFPAPIRSLFAVD